MKFLVSLIAIVATSFALELSRGSSLNQRHEPEANANKEEKTSFVVANLPSIAAELKNLKKQEI